MRELELPRCSELRKEMERLVISDVERGRIVQAMVEKGVEQGLDATIADAVKRGRGGGASSIYKAFERTRRKMAGQARDIRAGISKGSREARERELKRYDVINKDYSRKGRGLDKRFGIIDREIEELITDDELIDLIVQDDDDVTLSAWQRLVIWLRDVWFRFRMSLSRFWARITGRKVPGRARRTGRRMMLFGRDLSDGFRRALYASPSFRKGMDSLVKMKAEKGGGRRHDIYDADYEEAAAKAFQDYLRERKREVSRLKKKMVRSVEEERARLEKEREYARERHEDNLRNIEKKGRNDLGSVEGDIDGKAMEEVKDGIRKDFEEMGYIRKGDLGRMATSRMMDHFADILYGLEVRAMSTRFRTRHGASDDSQGIYEKMRLRSVHEESRADLMESVINARVNHPGKRGMYRDDILIHNEMSSTRNHVVLMFDKSGSMEENGRITAAKRAVLALYKAAKRQNRKNIVDLVAFDTRVKVTDLVELWGSEPAGFTNMGEALRTARGLVSGTRADRKVVYLITDGLPEAFTNGDGEAHAGDRAKSLEYAREQARLLGKVHGLRLIILLLEPEEDIYVDAATDIAKRAEGRLVVTDPGKLSGEMLADYAAT